MSSHTFQDVQIHPQPDGVRYTLPRRNLPMLKVVAAVIIAIDLVFAVAALATTRVPLVSGSFDLFDLLSLTVSAVVVLGPILLAVGLVRGYSEILVTRDRIYVIHRGMGWPIKRHGKRSDLTGLHVHVVRDQQGKIVDTGPLGNLSLIKADFGSARGSILLATGYPVQLVRDLADDLAARLGASVSNKLVADRDKPPVAVTEADWINDQFKSYTVDVPDQPADSTIVHEPIDGGFSLTVPPARIWKGSKGLAGFAFIWLLFCAGMSAAMVTSNAPWSALGAMVAFWLVGIAMLIGAIHMGRRQAIIDVIGDTLLVTVSGLFGTKQHEWSADQITSIHMGPNGMEVNNRPVMQLQIQPQAGKPRGLLTGRDEHEIRWVATILRNALKVEAGQPVDQKLINKWGDHDADDSDVDAA